MTPLTHLFWITISSLIFLNSHNYSSSPLLISGPSELVENTNIHLPDDIFDAESVDYPPLLTNREEIESLIGYPSVAWDAKIEGKVILRILVDEKGYYMNHEVAESFHPLLRIPCEEFAKFLAFTPAESNKQPVKCWVDVPFEFKIP